MDNSQHTPGPWVLQPATANDFAYVLIGGDAICIETDNPADALLIAAAPGLLAELKRQMEREWNPFEPKNQSDRYKRMKALYASATGSTHE